MIELLKEMANKNIGSLSLFLLNEKNKDYLEYLNNNIPSEILHLKVSEKLYYLINDLKELLLCECGQHRSFIGFKNGYRPTCGDKKCVLKKRKETCLKKYGVDNPKKSKSVIEKEKENIRTKWGLEHYMFSDSVRERFKSKMLERYGVEWAQQSQDIRHKSKKTWTDNIKKDEIVESRRQIMLNKSEIEKVEINNKRKLAIENKWGSYENFSNWRNKCISEQSMIKYGVDHHFKSSEVISKRIESYKKNILNKIISELPGNITFIDKRSNKNETDTILNFKCKNCSRNFEINRQLFYFRKNSNVEICLNCNPILSGKSNKELEVLQFIKNNYNGKIEVNTKNIIDSELDIHLPDINLSIEFNGLYWHSELYKDQLYHISKTNQCNQKGIDLFHIWEDDWDYKKEIVKSIILNKVGKISKIYARNCQIKEIYDTKLVGEFLNKNHIQGSVGSKIKLGLFYGDELVSLMTFGHLRRSLGKKRVEDVYELIRYCNKINLSVVGGASKLFKYFIKTYRPKEIISYSDSSRYQGNLYLKLGFELNHKTNPNYYWIINGIRNHRFNFRKDKLVKQGNDRSKTEIEIMHELGHYRIFDCGSSLWTYKTIY